jgi:hypothetical protein
MWRRGEERRGEGRRGGESDDFNIDNNKMSKIQQQLTA